MVNKVIVFIWITFGLTGCLGRKPFQPPPPEFKQWVKTGVTTENVKLIMLKCGFNNSYGNAAMENNAYAESQNCMFKRGFVHTSGFDICRGNLNLPACQYGHGE